MRADGSAPSPSDTGPECFSHTRMKRWLVHRHHLANLHAAYSGPSRLIGGHQVVGHADRGVGRQFPVHVPGQYATIQSAIDAAPTGATIVVAPGTYTEQVSITKSVSVRGAGAFATIIQAPQTLAPLPNVVVDPSLGWGQKISGLVVVGNHADVTISGVSVTGPVPCGPVVGVWATEGANLRLKDSTVSDLLA